ncbi:MAG: hypothetical protein M3Y75_14090 [Actinomycetota bacterium]|nr:hypothetical protein [Actinomycetota bacterium]
MEIIPAPKPKIVPHAADGRDNGWPSGDDQAGNGIAGEVGAPGFPGINNTSGGDTPQNSSLIIGDFVGTLEVTVRGGNGGNGGRGGKGGTGGEGQDGGAGNGEVPEGRGGRGGQGGPGGRGGNGGRGGDAHNVDLYIPNPEDAISINTSITFGGGFRGYGGFGGFGGDGGAGGLSGHRPDGERAQQGDPGPDGSSGTDGSRDGTSGHLNIYVGMGP